MPAVIWRAAVRLIAGHRLLAVALLPAFLLRVDAELGYRWQSWFTDSFSYVQSAVTLTPSTTRPSGYPVFLWLLSPFHSYLLVTALQHLMGLLVAVMIYALARHRFRVRPWIAVLAAVPVLYDGFEIQLEHLVMADTLFLFLAVAAVAVLLWSPRPSWRACLFSGLLVGVAATVRSTGLPLLAVFLLYIVIAYWRAWRALVAGLVLGAAAFAGPVLGYEGWFSSAHGEFAMTDATGVFLYSRVMSFADCSVMDPPADLLPLCTAVPPGQRPIAQDYLWTSASPLLRYSAPEFSPAVNNLAKRFAVSAIESQPLDYLRVVSDDTARAFEWNRSVFPNEQTYDNYLFGYHSPHIPGGSSSAAAAYARADAATRIVNPFAAVTRDYQRYAWLPGAGYGVILLAGLFGIVFRWRRGGRSGLLPWLGSLVIIVTPAMTAEFDYRYVTTATPFACLAAALAFASALRPALGPAGVARLGPGGGADRGLADAGQDQRDLAPDAT